MRPIVVVVRPKLYCPMCGSVAGNCIDAADICVVVEPLSMLNVAIFRSHFVDDIVAPNIDAPSSVAAAPVAVAVGFDAAIALARAALATNSVALDVDCMTTMMIVTMMMMVVWPPPIVRPLPTTFDCSKSLIEPSENKREEKKMRQFETIK